MKRRLISLFGLLLKLLSLLEWISRIKLSTTQQFRSCLMKNWFLSIRNLKTRWLTLIPHSKTLIKIWSKFTELLFLNKTELILHYCLWIGAMTIQLLSLIASLMDKLQTTNMIHALLLICTVKSNQQRLLLEIFTRLLIVFLVMAMLE